MPKKELVQYIYDNLVSKFPHITAKKQEHLQFILNFIDAFLSMYPSHSTEITPQEYRGYQYREITLFAIAEFDSFYQESSACTLDTFDIAQSISRFLFARHASLVGLRSRVSDQPQTQLYPIQFLDTTSFTFDEHKALLQKLTFCHVTSLSLIFPPAPGKEVMKVYISSIHTK